MLGGGGSGEVVWYIQRCDVCGEGKGRKCKIH